MPQNVNASPARTRRRWGVVLAIGAVAAGFLLVNRSCVRRRTATPVATKVAPAAVDAVASVTMPGDSNVAPVPAGTPTGPQMRAMVFEMDATGIRLSHSAIVDGRAKAPPMSNSPRRLEFQVYGPDGSLNYSGAFDHPLSQRVETVNDKGELAGSDRPLGQGSCLVRIPAEVPATRIEFFDVDTTSGAPDRRSIGSFSLQ